MDKMDKIIYSIIHMPNQPDNLKKSLIAKLVQSSMIKPNRELEQEDINAIFDCCINVLQNESEGPAVLAVFAFSSWARQHTSYLRNYLTPERFTSILRSRNNVIPLISLLKEALCILVDDTDFLSSSNLVLQDILQNMLKECGANSLFIAKLAELYVVCPSLLPEPHTRLSFTIMLMNCVASFPTPTKTEVLGHMKSIGGLVNTLWNGLRLEDILHSLHALYAIISNTDGGSQVCPAMAHLLSLVPTVVVERLAPRIVSDPTTTDAALVATLTRLTAWVVAWPTAHATLGLWLQTLIKLLYKSGRISVPEKITVERVPKLLAHVHIPVVRTGVISVSSTLLLSCQHTPEAFLKIIPQITNAIGKLEREGSETALAAVNRLTISCHVLMVLFPCYSSNYQQLSEILMKYQQPSEQEIEVLIQEYQWRDREEKSQRVSYEFGASTASSSTLVYQQRSTTQKAGLRNLGNTCYMNSVVQALFMTDSFRHGVLFSTPQKSQQLLMELQKLFSLLCFTHRSYIAPSVFHDKSRPPWFSPGMQQDCSEYLRHLMITLHEEEKAEQGLPEYQERFIIESETASITSDLQPLPYDSAAEDFVEVDSLSRVYGEQTNFIDVLHRHRENLGESPLHETNKQMTFGQDSTLCDRKSIDSGTTKNVKEHIIENNLNENGFKVLTDVDDSNEIMDNLIPDSRSCDRFGKNSCKRKYRINVDGLHRQMLKSPKGEDIDNNSDSGISGDLADDVSSQTPYLGSPVLKEQSSDNQGIIVEELVSKKDHYVKKGNEFFVSLVQNVFGGKLATCIKCLECKTESVHKDVFTDIHLAFQDEDQYNAASAIKRNSEKAGKLSQEGHVDLRIEDMIKCYLAPERLSGENQYACDKCNGKQDAERSIRILEPPDHLIVTQLRFYYDNGKGQRQKVFTNVEFGEELLLPLHTLGQENSIENSIPPNDSIKPLSIASLTPEYDCDTKPGFTNNLDIPEDMGTASGTYVEHSVCNIGSQGEDSAKQSKLNDCSTNKPTYDMPKSISKNGKLKESFSTECQEGYNRLRLEKETVDNFRISGSAENMSRSGLAEELEPTTFVRYALYGVVMHSGFSSEGGHYYCYARNSSIACLPVDAKQRFGNLGDWYNFNDERVTTTNFKSITNLTQTFSRDTVYQLFYKKFDATSENSMVEELKSLRPELQEAVESDNLRYRVEQDEEAKRIRFPQSNGPQLPRDSDRDGTPPPGGCGGGPGGGGFNTPSRVVF